MPLRKTKSDSAAEKKNRKHICLLDKSALPDSQSANWNIVWLELALYNTKIILRNMYFWELFISCSLSIPASLSDVLLQSKS